MVSVEWTEELVYCPDCGSVGCEHWNYNLFVELAKLDWKIHPGIYEDMSKTEPDEETEVRYDREYVKQLRDLSNNPLVEVAVEKEHEEYEDAEEMVTDRERRRSEYPRSNREISTFSIFEKYWVMGWDTTHPKLGATKITKRGIPTRSRGDALALSRGDVELVELWEEYLSDFQISLAQEINAIRLEEEYGPEA